MILSDSRASRGWHQQAKKKRKSPFGETKSCCSPISEARYLQPRSIFSAASMYISLLCYKGTGLQKTGVGVSPSGWSQDFSISNFSLSFSFFFFGGQGLDCFLPTSSILNFKMNAPTCIGRGCTTFCAKLSKIPNKFWKCVSSMVQHQSETFKTSKKKKFSFNFVLV